MQTLTWNTNREQIAPGRFRSDVRGKWINWLDADGWKTMSAAFVEDSGGFRAANIPGVYQAPANSNQPVTLSVEQRYNVFSKSLINDAPLVIEATPENIRNVAGILSPDLSSVVYPNTWADGVDLRYRVTQNRGPRVSREVVINSMPAGTGDLEFSWLIAAGGGAQLYKGNSQAWRGNPNDRAFIQGQGMVMRAGRSRAGESTERGSGIRTPKAWYYNADGEPVTTDIRVDFALVSRDVIRATKVIPRSLVVAALAAGSALYSDDTSTFYPDPSVEVTSVDGFVSYFQGSGMTWAEVQSQATSNGGDDNSSLATMWLRADSITNKYDDIDRMLLGFDTSPIDDTHLVDSSTLRIRPWDQISDTLGEHDLSLVSSSPASNTAIVSGDIDSLGSTKLATDMTNANWTAGTEQTFTLNAAGLTHIDNTGVTNFGIRFEPDAANVEPTWITGTQLKVRIKTADDAGTDNDPLLTVIHSAGATGSPIPYYNAVQAGALS